METESGQTLRWVFASPERMIATWFGCGLVPKGPGTAGSFGALLPAAALIRIGLPPLGFAALALLGSIPAIASADRVATETGRKDPSIVVVDEVIGQWITLCGAVRYTPLSILLAFGLFRLFDIWKPWPVRSLERLRGGVGIVMDDMMAGVYAALVLFLAGCFNFY